MFRFAAPLIASPLTRGREPLHSHLNATFFFPMEMLTEAKHQQSKAQNYFNKCFSISQQGNVTV